MVVVVDGTVVTLAGIIGVVGFAVDGTEGVVCVTDGVGSLVVLDVVVVVVGSQSQLYIRLSFIKSTLLTNRVTSH